MTLFFIGFISNCSASTCSVTCLVLSENEILPRDFKEEEKKKLFYFHFILYNSELCIHIQQQVATIQKPHPSLKLRLKLNFLLR